MVIYMIMIYVYVMRIIQMEYKIKLIIQSRSVIKRLMINNNIMILMVILIIIHLVVVHNPNIGWIIKFYLSH